VSQQEEVRPAGFQSVQQGTLHLHKEILTTQQKSKITSSPTIEVSVSATGERGGRVLGRIFFALSFLDRELDNPIFAIFFEIQN